jgi:glucokinase
MKKVYTTDMPSIIGFDLGGTKSAVSRFDSKTLKEQANRQLPTDADRGWDHVYKDIIRLIKDFRTKDTKAIGIGVPGLVIQSQGLVINMPNIPGAKNIALKKQLEKALDLPVYVENDVNCFTIAEACHGAGKANRVVVGLMLGTGVGGGIVIDKKLFNGEHGYAAEVGHMLLMPGHPPYETKDIRGEVEQYLSGTALGERCRSARSPKDYLSGEACQFLQPYVFREVAWLCVNLTHLLDPGMIVFGGSTGRALKPHIKKIEKEISSWILPGTPLPKITIGRLDNTVSLGAALITN